MRAARSPAAPPSSSSVSSLDLLDRVLEAGELADHGLDVLGRCDRRANLVARGHRDVVDAEHVRRIRGGDQHRLGSRKAIGTARKRRASAALTRFGGALVDLEDVQVDVVEPVALGQRMGELVGSIAPLSSSTSPTGRPSRAPRARPPRPSRDRRSRARPRHRRAAAGRHGEIGPARARRRRTGRRPGARRTAEARRQQAGWARRAARRAPPERARREAPERRKSQAGRGRLAAERRRWTPSVPGSAPRRGRAGVRPGREPRRRRGRSPARRDREPQPRRARPSALRGRGPALRRGRRPAPRGRPGRRDPQGAAEKRARRRDPRAPARTPAARRDRPDRDSAEHRTLPIDRQQADSDERGASDRFPS